MKKTLVQFYRVSMLVWLLLIFFSFPVNAEYRNGIPVLLYHHVTDDNTDLPKLTVSDAEFERQIHLLRANGFETISLDSLLAFMKNEQVKLPEKPILITFDDGYEDNYTNAFPILKKYGYTATIFMVGINFDRQERLSSQEINEMITNGFTVGGHSMTHRDLRQLTGSELSREVYGSKRKAEQVTHTDVNFFAYPGGFCNVATLEAVKGAGYAGAFTVLTGLNNPANDNVYFMRRIPIFSSTDFDKLLALLNANHPKTSLLDYDSEKDDEY